MRSDKAGVYYYKWVNRGSKAPTVDKMSKGTKVSANKDFTISLKDLDANNAIDVYGSTIHLRMLLLFRIRAVPVIINGFLVTVMARLPLRKILHLPENRQRLLLIRNLISVLRI